MHVQGVVAEQPGLYFVGLNFLYSKSSDTISGVGRDARRIAMLIASREPVRRPKDLVA
jgi:putative flavoprotein involved in K+ transport